jgi:hypothetical protein
MANSPPKGAIMKIKEGCAAVGSGRRQEWHYGGYALVVEVQACGFKGDDAVARAWRVNGGQAGRSEGWSLFSLRDVHLARELAELCHAPREGYGHPDFELDATACQTS